MRRLILAAMITAAFRPVQALNELRQDLLQRAGEYVRQFEADEMYRLPRNIETITCTAIYSNARRFETSARIVK